MYTQTNKQNKKHISLKINAFINHRQTVFIQNHFLYIIIYINELKLTTFMNVTHSTHTVQQSGTNLMTFFLFNDENLKLETKTKLYDRKDTIIVMKQ